MTAIYKEPFDRLEIFLDEYQPQLEKALNAIKIIKVQSNIFSEYTFILAIFKKNSTLPHSNVHTVQTKTFFVMCSLPSEPIRLLPSLYYR